MQPLLPAPAGGAGLLVLAGPRERVVPPLAGDRVRAGEDPAVHDDSAARAGPDDDAEDARGSGGRAVARLGEGEAVRVVGEADVAAEEAGEVGAERAAEEPGGVRVLHEAGCGGDRPGHSDADRPARAERRLDLGDEAGDRREGPVVVGRGRAPQTKELAAALAQGQRLGLRPAEVDADPQRITPRCRRSGR